MATALRLTGGEEVEETAKFVEYVDKFFDCVNVGDFTSGMRSRNPFKSPYYSGSDFRLKVYNGIDTDLFYHHSGTIFFHSSG